MADEKKSDGGGGLAGALPVSVVLAMLASLVFTQYLPYQDERPPNHPLQLHYEAAQDVDARLWQDPFAAVDDVSEDAPTEKLVILASQVRKTLEVEVRPSVKSQSHGPKQIYIGNAPVAGDDITVIAITLTGGPYQEAEEARMRRRYAVLSALANQQATPRDDQHIGYFHPDSEMGLQKKVAFEWWSLAETNKKVLLLWVDESSLFGHPATKLKELIGQTDLGEHAQAIAFHYTVIGPNTSSLLLDMLKEVEVDAPGNKASVAECPKRQLSKVVQTSLGEINCEPIVYYPAGATASDYRLLKDGTGRAVGGETVSDRLCKQGVTLYRATATDRELMDILVDELGLRQVKKTDQVVILSEWDTYYGRSMPNAFKHSWDTRGQDKNGRTDVEVYSYMRGLDGKLSDKDDKKTATVAEKKTDSNDKDKSQAAASVESPEGQNQKDYLRRLAEQINERDQELKDGGASKGVAAIGVLGSDVHDKLMILEALRQHFPHKLFFTTDLDAAYSHPGKWRQTHNLLVASAYDLALRPELQGSIPPFRDSYQTAFFLAAQMILNADAINADQIESPPLLYEIGRSHPAPLRTNALATDGSNKTQCSWKNWPECNDAVQPQVFAVAQIDLAWKGVIAVIAGMLFFIFVSSWFRKKMKEAFEYGTSHHYWMMVMGALLFLVLSAWNCYIIQYNAEPLYWREGVSIWPSQLLRLLVPPFAYFFLRWGNKRIIKMQEKLQGQLPSTFVLPGKNMRLLGYWKVLFIGNWKQDGNRSKTVYPSVLWRKYLLYFGQNMTLGVSGKQIPFPGWLWRAAIHGLAFFLAAFMLIYLSGFPNVPARGDVALWVNRAIIFLAVLSTIFLSAWVVENARLCEQLITVLSDKPSKWTKDASDWAITEKMVARECVDDWLDINLVARLTATMQPLIWGPVICIALLLLARSPAIDDWDIPWGLEMVFIAMLFYSISAEVFLQYGAKSARKKAIAQLTEKISGERNLGAPKEVVIKRIEAETERIRDLREGAFRPWHELPLLRSFGGLGTLWVALQYFAGVWGNGSL